MKSIKLTIAALILGMFALPALAQTNTPNIDKRQVEQQKRIDQGKASGQLTDKEAARLEKGQAKVKRMEDKAKADGKVTAAERKRIEHEQNKQSRRIEKEKHNKEHK
jgi:uncharacterized membrane protein YebE (DUF533 family)